MHLLVLRLYPVFIFTQCIYQLHHLWSGIVWHLNEMLPWSHVLSFITFVNSKHLEDCTRSLRRLISDSVSNQHSTMSHWTGWGVCSRWSTRLSQLSMDILTPVSETAVREWGARGHRGSFPLKWPSVTVVSHGVRLPYSLLHQSEWLQ